MVSGECILITGAAGFTGRHACHYFKEKGLKVVALVHRNCSELDSDLEVIACDLLDAQAALTAVQQAKPDYVLHLAGANSVSASWKQALLTQHVNVLGTLHVLDALRAMPHVKALVISSKLKTPLSDIQSPKHPYGFSKAVQGLVTHAWRNMFGLDVRIAEPTNLIGPGPSTGVCALIGQYVAQSERGWKESHLLLNDRQVKRDYLDVRDAVAAYDAILEQGESGGIYSIESGVTRDLDEIVQTFRRLALVDVPFRWEYEYVDPVAEVQVQSEKCCEASVGAEEMPISKRWEFSPTWSFEHSAADILNYYRNEGEGML